MIGTTSSGTLIVLFGMYASYIHAEWAGLYSGPLTATADVRDLATARRLHRSQSRKANARRIAPMAQLDLRTFRTLRLRYRSPTGHGQRRVTTSVITVIMRWA